MNGFISLYSLYTIQQISYINKTLEYCFIIIISKTIILHFALTNYFEHGKIY